MTGAVPASTDPPTLGGVLRLAGAILRRRAPLLALLVLTLEVAPVLLLHAVDEPVRRAIAPPFDTVEASVFAFSIAVGYFGAYALAAATAFGCTVAVVLVGSEEDRAPGAMAAQVRRVVLRLVAFALAIWFAAVVLTLWLPQPWSSCASAVLSCWGVVLPVDGAEGVPVSRLAGRSRAAFARAGHILAAILFVDCAGAVGSGLVHLHFFQIFGRGTAAVWAGLAAISAASAAFNVAADTAVVALYRELRRRERAIPPTALVEAFE